MTFLAFDFKRLLIPTKPSRRVAGDIDIGNYRSWADFWSRPWSTA